MFLQEQVVGILIVDLHERSGQFVVGLDSPLFELVEETGQDSRDDPAQGPSVCDNLSWAYKVEYTTSSVHGECLATACLSIRKNSAVVSFQTILDDRTRHSFEQVFLRRLFVEDSAEPKLETVFGVAEHFSATDVDFDSVA